MRCSLLIVFILCLSTCCRAQNNYIIFRPSEKPGIVRIYIDRAGWVYPSKDYVDSTKFPRVDRKDPEYADLKAYFLKYDLQAYAKVLADNGVKDFDRLQEKLITDCAFAINKKLMSSKKLVVLIHGFNEYAARPFDSLETEIRKRYKDDEVTYLEVYWDGLKAYRELPADVFKIWFRANRTAPYAAMTLRKLFTRIDDADLYIITHSLGACVGTRLLFNTKESRRFPFKKKWKGIPTPKQSSITLAVLAPAIAGPRVFRCLRSSVPPGDYHNVKRVVVGYDKYDVATTKSMRFPLSGMFYSTSLGCNPANVRRTARILRRIYPSLQVRATDFSRDVNGKKNRIHHIDKYINDTMHFNQFLDNVFSVKN